MRSLTIFLLILLAVDMQAQLSISPAMIEIPAPPNTIIKKLIFIANQSEQSVAVNIQLTDFNLNEWGQPEFPGQTEKRFSNSEWISVRPAYMKLEKKSQQAIELRMIVPPQLKRATCFAVLFTPQMDNRLKKGMFKLTSVLTCLVFIQPAIAGTQKLEIVDLAQEQDDVFCIIRNVSDYYVRVKGNATVFFGDHHSREIDFGNEGELILPGMSRRFLIPELQNRLMRKIKAVMIRCQAITDNRQNILTTRKFLFENNR